MLRQRAPNTAARHGTEARGHDPGDPGFLPRVRNAPPPLGLAVLGPHHRPRAHRAPRRPRAGRRAGARRRGGRCGLRRRRLARRLRRCVLAAPGRPAVGGLGGGGRASRPGARPVPAAPLPRRNPLARHRAQRPPAVERGPHRVGGGGVRSTGWPFRRSRAALGGASALAPPSAARAPEPCRGCRWRRSPAAGRRTRPGWGRHASPWARL